jgi:hypothetical protein
MIPHPTPALRVFSAPSELFPIGTAAERWLGYKLGNRGRQAEDAVHERQRPAGLADRPLMSPTLGFFFIGKRYRE